MDFDNVSSKAERLYRRYSRLMLKTAREATDDWQMAEDAVQHAFEKVIGRIDTIDESNERRVGGLMLTMVKQAVYDLYKAKKGKQVVPVEDPVDEYKESGDDVFEEVLQRVSPEEMRSALSWLSPKYFEPLWMYSVDDITVPEIAERLNISEKNAYMRIDRAKKKIRDRMKKNGGWSL